MNLTKDTSGGEDYKILFLHLPKTASKTLETCIYHMHADVDYSVDDTGYFHSGVYFYPFDFWSDPDSPTPPVAQEVLRRKDLRVAMGHFGFGLHEMIEGPKTYLTILRDPVRRVLSLYFHARNEESVEEFMDHRAPIESSNDQTRRISGNSQSIDTCNKSMFEIAKENMANYFSVVGITERFDETLVLMMHKSGWSAVPLYLPEHVNLRRADRQLCGKL